MSPEFQAFRRYVQLARQETGRLIYNNQFRESLRSKGEGQTVRTLVKIVDCALGLSRRKGFGGLQLSDLSAAVGLGAGSLSAFAPTKDALLHLIQSYGLTLSARVLLDQIQDVHEPQERLRVALRSYLWLSEILQDWFFFAYMETRLLIAEERRQALQAELSVEELFANIIRSGQRQGVFRPVDAQLSAALLKAVLQDWCLERWKYEQRQMDVETYGAFVQELIERHLRVE